MNQKISSQTDVLVPLQLKFRRSLYQQRKQARTNLSDHKGLDEYQRMKRIKQYEEEYRKMLAYHNNQYHSLLELPPNRQQKRRMPRKQDIEELIE